MMRAHSFLFVAFKKIDIHENFLSSSLLPSFIIFYLSSYTRLRLSVESACFLMFFMCRHIGEYISLELFCSIHENIQL